MRRLVKFANNLGYLLNRLKDGLTDKESNGNQMWVISFRSLYWPNSFYPCALLERMGRIHEWVLGETLFMLNRCESAQLITPVSAPDGIFLYQVLLKKKNIYMTEYARNNRARILLSIWRMKRMFFGWDRILSLFPLVGNCPFSPAQFSLVSSKLRPMRQEEKNLDGTGSIRISVGYPPSG